ncbi:hypothetical protein NC652_010046 [Populus alba x Populus x berolinensis]|nr:hypothetical protein NC652_010046 [Populus alba x Populus x berolinensis]
MAHCAGRTALPPLVLPLFFLLFLLFFPECPVSGVVAAEDGALKLLLLEDTKTVVTLVVTLVYCFPWSFFCVSSALPFSVASSAFLRFLVTVLSPLFFFRSVSGHPCLSLPFFPWFCFSPGSVIDFFFSLFFCSFVSSVSFEETRGHERALIFFLSFFFSLQPVFSGFILP